MARIDRNAERYQAFVDAFLTLGPRFSAVAKRVSSTAFVAKGVWEQGWPDLPFAVPVSKLYAEALSRLNASKADLEAKEKTAQRNLLSADAAYTTGAVSALPPSQPRPLTPVELLNASQIGALQTEIDLLQAFRCNLVGALNASGRMLPAFSTLAEAVAQYLGLQAQNPAGCPPGVLLGHMEKFGKILGQLTTSTKQVMEMQRLLVGAPMQITETRGNLDINQGDLTERLARASRALDLMKRYGEGQVIEPVSSEPTYSGEETNMPDSMPPTPTPPATQSDNPPDDSVQGPDSGQDDLLDESNQLISQ